ncbi:MAG: type II secretion system protein [Patescibacteria group bacterium]
MICINIKTKAFTLIELLVVIAIIGMLSSIVLVVMGGTREKGRDSRRLQDLQQLRLALEIYYDRYGNYPEDGPGCNYIAVDGQNDVLTTILRNEGIVAGLTDPEVNSGCRYYYGSPSWWWSCSKSYQIEMRFETREGARLADEAGGECWDYSGGYNWGSGVCAGYNCAFPSP